MKKNALSLVAIFLSIIAIVISVIALLKVDEMKPVHTAESITAPSQQGQTQSTAAKHPFDQSLIGDWSGTYADGRDYVKMKVLEDSTILIEAKDLQNYYLYIGYIENNTTVIENRVYLGTAETYLASDYLAEHDQGDAIKSYLNDPQSMNVEEYSIARPLSRPATDVILVNFGVVQSSAGEITVTLTRQ